MARSPEKKGGVQRQAAWHPLAPSRGKCRNCFARAHANGAPPDPTRGKRRYLRASPQLT